MLPLVQFALQELFDRREVKGQDTLNASPMTRSAGSTAQSTSAPKLRLRLWER